MVQKMLHVRINLQNGFNNWGKVSSQRPNLKLQRVRCALTALPLPSLSLSLSGRARGPVSDQSPLRRSRLTGGCLSCGNTHMCKHTQTHSYSNNLSIKVQSKIALMPKLNPAQSPPPPGCTTEVVFTFQTPDSLCRARNRRRGSYCRAVSIRLDVETKRDKTLYKQGYRQRKETEGYLTELVWLIE